jgi:hypothetical protein
MYGSVTQKPVTLKLVEMFQDKVGRRGLDRRRARVAIAAGVMPYLKRSDRTTFYEQIFAQMAKVGTHWTGYREHGELLRSFAEVGGLRYCPEKIQRQILKWLVLLFLGEPGGRTIYGNIRHVFYSNTGAPFAYDLIRDAREIIAPALREIAADRDVRDACEDKYVAKRWQALLDVVEAGSKT